MSVTITVPSAGMIVVNAWQYDSLFHLNGATDAYWMKIAAAGNDCSPDMFLATMFLPSALPQSSYALSNTLQRIYTVGAGTFTYYVNGYMFTGGGVGDVFIRGNVVAVFYPS
jgi:hypothetical protein